MSTPEVNPWTPGREAELRKLAAQGLSSSRIAVLLGLKTRNQVIGKLHRLGIELGSTTRRETIAQTAKLRQVAERAAKAKAEAPQKPEPEPKKVVPLRRAESPQFAGPSKLLADLCSGECHWPLNDPGPGRMDETRFCAAPGAPAPGEGLPFCEHHHRRAVVPSKERKAGTEPTSIRRRAC